MTATNQNSVIFKGFLVNPRAHEPFKPLLTTPVVTSKIHVTGILITVLFISVYELALYAKNFGHVVNKNPTQKA